MSYIPKDRLKGKIAMLTASTEGIGFAIAQRLAREGAHVLISSRNKENVDAALEKLKADGLDATGVVCHVSNAEHRQNLFDAARQLGGLDILVSNASINPTLCNAIDCTESAWDKMFDVNLKASFLLTKESLPLFKSRGGGNIIYMSSIVSFHTQTDFHFAPNGKSPVGAYGVTKTALNALTKAMSVDLAPENIRVNCVAPGLIRTKFMYSLAPIHVLDTYVRPNILLNRYGIVQEVAGVVAFLVSDDAAYITGEIVPISGGMVSRL